MKTILRFTVTVFTLSLMSIGAVIGITFLFLQIGVEIARDVVSKWVKRNLLDGA